MLLNVSYTNPEIKRQIAHEVGKPFSLKERWKMGGIGIGRLPITNKSIHIHKLLSLDSNRDVCGIEMRPKGIIVGFRSLLESFALVIPYWKLNLYKGRAEEYSIYRDTYFIKIAVKAKDKSTHQFMYKILAAKTKQTLPNAGDL